MNVLAVCILIICLALLFIIQLFRKRINEKCRIASFLGFSYAYISSFTSPERYIAAPEYMLSFLRLRHCADTETKMVAQFSKRIQNVRTIAEHAYLAGCSMIIYAVEAYLQNEADAAMISRFASAYGVDAGRALEFYHDGDRISLFRLLFDVDVLASPFSLAGKYISL